MVSRLVLGSGGSSRAVVETLDARHGDLTVIDSGESRIRALREEGIRAEVGDPSDPAVLAAHDPDVVFVATADPERNRTIAENARTAFPDAHLVAYLGLGASGAVRDAVAGVVDEVVDPGAALAGKLLDVVESASGIRTRQLRTTLQALPEPLAIVTHDNPDPDAIASALALRTIASAFGVEATICYYGGINHQENRAMVNLLDLDLRNLDPGEDLSEFGSFALVDHSRPGVNDQLPVDTEVDVVIDHHPPRAPVDARFIDLRHDVGATSTLLVDYFDRLGIPMDETVATALLYGIRVDTRDFSREVATTDFQAAARLLERADLDVLERIENPSVSPDTMAVLARAIRNREVDGAVLASFVGEIRDRDALAQAADMLLNMDGVSATLVFGYIDTTVYASARARGTDLDLGETLRLAFDKIGSAGGHADMAGAQVPLKSIVVLAEEDEDPEEVIAESILRRFFETLRDLPSSLTERYPVEGPTGGFGFTPTDITGVDESEP